jgi:hypothetical protein
MTVDFTTSEMKAVWRDARWLLINAASAGFMLVKVAGDQLAGTKEAMPMWDWILLGIGCYCLVASVLGGRNLLRVVASIHRHLARSQVFAVSALAFLCGSAFGGALAGLRATGFQLATQFENAVPARVSFFLALVAAGWLISTALVPLLLNRRSLQ